MVARRVAWQIQHHDRIVFEHVAVAVDFLQFPSSTEPMREGFRILLRIGFRPGTQSCDVSLPHQQARLREMVCLTGVVLVVVADADDRKRCMDDRHVLF